MNPGVVIVRGGIAGLAAAHRLQRHVPSLLITVLDSEARLGGKIVTERASGFVVEGGPDAFLASKPRGVGLCRELGLADRLQGLNPQAGRAQIMRGGQLHPLPEGLSGLIPGRLGPLLRSALLSPAGKLRLLLDWVLPARTAPGDESLASFMRRRLGAEAYQRLVEPLMSGIYGGDGEQLSLDATFPQLRRLEQSHGSILRGVRAGRPAPAPKPSPFLTLPGGLAELVDTLANQLAAGEVQLMTRVGVTSITPDAGSPGHYWVHRQGGAPLPARAVIVATPATAAASLLNDLDPSLAQQLGAIHYAPAVTVSLAYHQQDLPAPLHSTGYIVPRAEGRPVLACTFSSIKFAHRAPEDYVLLRVFFGRADKTEMFARSDTELERLAQDELRQTLGLRAAPAQRWVYRWAEGLPQYQLGHLDRLATIRRRLAFHPGLALAGAAYQGVGLPDCIASGEAAADEVLAVMGAKESIPT
jgi:protoporphyrinogen/coproporphyrinogen III oxidase